MRKISPTSGFDPRAVQPVASRYTDWATRLIVFWGTSMKWRLYTKRDSLYYSECNVVSIVCSKAVRIDTVSCVYANCRLYDILDVYKGTTNVPAGSEICVSAGWRNYNLILTSGEPGSSVGIATELRGGRSGIESRWGRDFSPVQTDPEAHAASCKMGTGSFTGLKRPGRGFDHAPQSSAEVKERIELYLYSL